MKIFVAYPMHERERVSDIIKALIEEGVEVLNPFIVKQAGIAQFQASELINSADVVVAIIGELDKEANYELGLAVGSGKHIVILRGSAGELPLDLEKIPFIKSSGISRRDAAVLTRELSKIEIYQPHFPIEFQSEHDALWHTANDADYLASLTGIEFERLIADWFRAQSYFVDDQIRDTLREAVDFVAVSPHGRPVAVEVKKMNPQNRVSIESVERLVAAALALEVNRGLLVATTGFTSAALDLGAKSSIALRSLEELVAAKSTDELLMMKDDGGKQEIGAEVLLR